MPIRHAQRKHIIHSLNSLLYQLHTASFLLSPRLWPFLLRISTQSQFSRPRNIDQQRSLRFWFVLVLVIHLQCLVQHVFAGPAEGRSIVLDFVGIGPKPPKTFLILLDLIIILLELILVTISYETSFILAMPPDTPDPLQPESGRATPALPFPLDGPSSKPFEPTISETETEYIIDLRLRTLLSRLRNPPPAPPVLQPGVSGELLPLPNTTPFQLSRSLNMLVRARAELRERAARTAEDARGNRLPRNAERRERGPGDDVQRVPGGMDNEDL